MLRRLVCALLVGIAGAHAQSVVNATAEMVDEVCVHATCQWGDAPKVASVCVAMHASV